MWSSKTNTDEQLHGGLNRISDQNLYSPKRQSTRHFLCIRDIFNIFELCLTSKVVKYSTFTEKTENINQHKDNYQFTVFQTMILHVKKKLR